MDWQIKLSRREAEAVARKVARALCAHYDICRDDNEGPGRPVDSEELRKFIQKEMKSYTRLEDSDGDHV